MSATRRGRGDTAAGVDEWTAIAGSEEDQVRGGESRTDDGDRTEASRRGEGGGCMQAGRGGPGDGRAQTAGGQAGGADTAAEEEIAHPQVFGGEVRAGHDHDRDGKTYCRGIRRSQRRR